MLRRFVAASGLVVLACMAGAPGAFGDRMRRPDPRSAQQGDPDTAAVADERVRGLYFDTIITLRELDCRSGNPFDNLRAVRAFEQTPKAQGDADYIIAAGHAALDETPPDWRRFRTALWAAKAGMQGDGRVPGLARRALCAERGEKLSDAQGYAIKDAIEALGNNGTPEAATLLVESAIGEIWGVAPIRSRALSTNPRLARVMVRSRAVKALGKMRSDVSVPVLEGLAARYPNLGPGRYDPRTGDDTLEQGWGYRVRKALWEAKTRAGLLRKSTPPERGDMGPDEYIEALTGMTFDEYTQQGGAPPCDGFMAEIGITREGYLEGVLEFGLERIIGLSFEEYLESENP